MLEALAHARDVEKPQYTSLVINNLSLRLFIELHRVHMNTWWLEIMFMIMSLWRVESVSKFVFCLLSFFFVHVVNESVWSIFFFVFVCYIFISFSFSATHYTLSGNTNRLPLVARVFVFVFFSCKKVYRRFFLVMTSEKGRDGGILLCFSKKSRGEYESEILIFCVFFSSLLSFPFTLFLSLASLFLFLASISLSLLLSFCAILVLPSYHSTKRTEAHSVCLRTLRWFRELSKLFQKRKEHSLFGISLFFFFLIVSRLLIGCHGWDDGIDMRIKHLKKTWH